MPASIIAIGNPGAGKSTVLNSIANKKLFESGVSIGKGLTYRLHEEVTEKGVFYDTPGLADDELRKKAADAIRDSLRKGGTFILLFFISQEAGRIVKQDKTTMKLVLEATPEIKNNYGIIINQVPEQVAKLLQREDLKQRFVTKLLIGIDDDRKCAPRNITYILENSQLQAKNNVLVNANDLKNLEGTSFLDFVYGQVPTVELTQGAAKDIDVNKFERTVSENEKLETRLEKDQEFFQEQINKLVRQFQVAEEERDRHRARERLEWEERTKALKDALSENKKKIQNDAKQRALLERQIKDQKLAYDQQLYQMKMREQFLQAQLQKKKEVCIVM